MRGFNLPNGKRINLDAVVDVDPLFINKNYAEYNCYEVHMSDGRSFPVFEKDLSRDSFIMAWSPEAQA